MRYQTTAAFDAALATLPREHRARFIDAVRDHLVPALAAGAHHGAGEWPTRLRIHKIDDAHALTWSFSRPGWRALFTIGPHTDGDPVLTWLAISHDEIKA
ncbi:MAG: hypothetical protein J2P27_14260 [Actinobacteria bacterium]|nr:hypothetical protein [Actinomycetota bacterium]